MKLKILLTAIILILCTTLAVAQTDPAPTVSITALPGTSVTSSVTIRATARDNGAAAGISQLDIYANNNVIASKNCGYSTSCTLSKPVTSTTAKKDTYHAIAYDRSQHTQSSSITVTFRGVNTPPNLSALPNRTINEDSGYNANLTDLWAYATDTWTNASNLMYNLINQTNLSVANCSIINNRWVNCNTTTKDAFGFSIISIQATDGQLTKKGNFTLFVAPVNDAPVFNATIPVITFAEDTAYVFNISDYVSDVDNLVSAFSFIPASTGNITVTYAYNASINKVQATLTPAQDWNGAVTTNFTASDGINSSGPSNNVLITITNVNDRPFFSEENSISELDDVNLYKDVFFSYQLNASDIDAGDVLTYYDNTTLFNIDVNTGWINFTPNSTGNYTILLTVCDDSGAANNCTNGTWDLEIWEHPPIQFDNIQAVPASPTAYTENKTYNFSVTPLMSEGLTGPQIKYGIDKIWLEFGGINYSATNATVILANLSAGNYTYRWHGNLTCGLHYNSSRHNYIIERANSTIILNIPGNWTYGTAANVSCTANGNQTPTLLRNGTVVSNPDNTLLGAGIYAYFCYINQSQNYTAANSTGTLTVSPIQVTVDLVLQTPITYGTAANISCNASPSSITPTLTRNGAALPGLTDNSVLGAGNYTYACYYNTTQNYTGDNETKMLVLDKAQAVVNLTLNGTDGDISLPINGSVITVIGTPVIPSNSLVELFINGTLAASGTGAQTVNYNFSAGGTYPVMVRYNATQNYTAASETHYVVVGSALAKINIAPALNSNINGTSIALRFNTNLNTSCRWSLTDQNYSAMTNTFTTTGLKNHSGTIIGLNTLGAETIYVACINETTGSNSDWNYNILNIFVNSQINNSTLANVTANKSVINGSIMTNCTVINSTVKNYMGSNCVIKDSFVDPPNPGNNLTESTITGNSRVMNSNVTYSYVDSSTITNSDVNNSNISNGVVITSSNVDDSTIKSGSTVQNSTVSDSNLTNARITGCTATNSALTNSQVDCDNLINANITNNAIYSGVIVQGNVTYNASLNGTANLSSIINVPPNAAFTYRPSSPRKNQNIKFNAGSSSDPNPGDTLTYFWNFGDGTNATNATATHKYVSAGAYTVNLTVTDNRGLSDYQRRMVTVTSGSGSGNNYIGGGGGGGGGGGSAYARNWKIDLDVRSMEIKTFGRRDTAVITINNKTYTLRMQDINREQANFTIKEIPYSMVTYEIKKIDLDNDGISEIRIIFLNNYLTRAQLRFDRYEEMMNIQPVPLISGNLSNLGLSDETLNVEELKETEEKKKQIKEETEETGETGEAPEKETESWAAKLLEKIPKDSETVGLGITIGVVIAGLVVYFLISLIIV